jgi:paraquat-inducible protein B
MAFKESVRGLTVGSSVDYRGLPVGEVTKIDLKLNHETSEFLILVEINLYPERFVRRTRNALPGEEGEDRAHKVLDLMVKHGFRAQLRTGSIVSGQRYIALDFFKNTKAASVDWTQRIPELPTQPGTLDSLEDQVLVIVEGLRKTVNHVDGLVLRLDQEVVPELNMTLRDARKTLQNAEQTLSSEAPLQTELRDTLREVSKAAATVRNLADMLERQPEALLKGRKEE